MRNSRRMNITISIFMVILSILLVTLATLGYMDPLLASILLGVTLILPFLLMFERRRVKCKMVVLISTLSAIAIVGRWAFAWAPNITLSTGIVILAGVSLGGVPGFMVGALTMLVSNMLLGQGLWTIWQMLVTGLVGMVAHLFHRSDRWTLSLFALFVGFAYGFIMDIFTLVTVYKDAITWQAFLVVWGASFYFDLVHAISTVLAVNIFYKVIVGTVRRELDSIKY